MTESPAELLERAAAHLEQVATCFNGYLREADQEAQRGRSPAQWWAHDVVDRNATRTSQQWVETMSPVVAAPLVAWMRTTARYLHFEHGAVSSPENAREFFDGKYGGALEFARRILGEHTEESP